MGGETDQVPGNQSTTALGVAGGVPNYYYYYCTKFLDIPLGGYLLEVLEEFF